VQNPRLHPDTIAEVKNRVDILDLISDYVVLRKRGKDFVGLCPFHEEKTPSFTVSASKQFYHCFGCGVGGSAITFLMEIGKQSFMEVVLNLAQRYQIPIKTLAPEQSQQIQQQISLKQQLYEVLALTATFYHHTLHQKEGKKALDYLQKNRNLTGETIQKFQLGYSPNGWETIFHYLVEVKHYPVSLVEKAGLIKKRNQGNGFYDQFRDRLMIPILDQQGRIIAFGSRCLDGSEPKYLNSPDTILFNKSKVLFALDKAKNSIIKQDQVIVVEGYFDAIALHSVGIENVVASLGTAFTQDHVKQLLRYTESQQIIFNFDADQAGLKATERAIKQIESLVYSGQVQLKIINIPQGKDADDFLKSSNDAMTKYQELVKNAPLWIDWQIDQIVASKDLKKSLEFQQVFQSLVNILNKINNASTRNHYISYCAELLSKNKSDYLAINPEDFQQIQRSLQLAIKRQPLTKRKSNYIQSLIQSVAASPEEKLLEKAEFLLLLIYLHCPEHRPKIIDTIEEKDLLFTVSHHRYLWQAINQIEQDDNSEVLINILEEDNILDSNLRKKLTALFHPDYNQKEYLFNPAEIVISAIATLEWLKNKKYYQYCQQKWRNLDINNEPEKMTFYNQELQNTKLMLDELESRRLLK
jgi:DNA primase